jgi:hypothetical protein
MTSFLRLHVYRSILLRRCYKHHIIASMCVVLDEGMHTTERIAMPKKTSSTSFCRPQVYGTKGVARYYCISNLRSQSSRTRATAPTFRSMCHDGQCAANSFSFFVPHLIHQQALRLCRPDRGYPPRRCPDSPVHQVVDRGTYDDGNRP